MNSCVGASDADADGDARAARGTRARDSRLQELPRRAVARETNENKLSESL